MLINKGFSSGDIVVIKMFNGDELIARFEEEADDVIKVSKPLAVTIGPQGLGMIPWIFLGDTDTYSIRKKDYYVMVRAKKDAADQYMEGTTGISLR